MANNDFFGKLGNLGSALGGLMDGLAKSGLVAKNTPLGRLLAAQSELADLKQQESEILLEIGRQAYEQNPTAWTQDAKLKLIRQNIAATQAEYDTAKQAKNQAETAKAAEDAKGRCLNCGHKNQESVKFCQECGTPLSAAVKVFCTTCGEELAVGSRFCGECGARQGAE